MQAERRNAAGSALRLVRSGDRVRVYQGSAERLLAALPDRSIDLLLTDPPYTTVERRSTSGHLRDWFPDGLSWPQIGRILALARRKLKPSGVAMAMTNGAGLGGAIAAMKAAGFTEVRTVTWDRRWPGLGGGLRHQTEFVLVGRTSGSRSLVGTDLVSVAAVGPGTADRYPTTKPIGLGRELARMAGIGRGSLVVDPFAGSGALLVGSLERGASVVAGDVASRAVNMAARRLVSGTGQPTKPTTGPVATRRKATKPTTGPLTARRKATKPTTGPVATRQRPTKPTTGPVTTRRHAWRPTKPAPTRQKPTKSKLSGPVTTRQPTKSGPTGPRTMHRSTRPGHARPNKTHARPSKARAPAKSRTGTR
jgi:site-specific DNA-methyltransferase (adenine-specific)